MKDVVIAFAVVLFLVVATLKVNVWEPILTDITGQIAYAITHTEPGQK